MPRRSTASVLALAAISSLFVSGVGCFDSDELRSSEETESSGGDTVTMYSDETADTSDDNWTAEETGPFETTCRDAIDCLVMCQVDLFLNPEPEPDLSCFLECDMGLSTEEAYKLIKLAECIGNMCCGRGGSVWWRRAPISTVFTCIAASTEQDPAAPGLPRGGRSLPVSVYASD